MCDSDTFTQKNLYVKENISIFALGKVRTTRLKREWSASLQLSRSCEFHLRFKQEATALPGGNVFEEEFSQKTCLYHLSTDFLGVRNEVLARKRHGKATLSPPVTCKRHKGRSKGQTAW